MIRDTDGLKVTPKQAGYRCFYAVGEQESGSSLEEMLEAAGLEKDPLPSDRECRLICKFIEEAATRTRKLLNL